LASSEYLDADEREADRRVIQPLTMRAAGVNFLSNKGWLI
jgi:hypothetical protein